MRFSLTINDIVCDLFQDESVSLTRQVKDFSKIDTVFTDYTQSFQIPATDINNAVFYNYFVEEVNFPTWNANQKLPASIEIDGMPVFYGTIELLEVAFKDQLPQSYSVVFYGQMKNLTTLWGEKTLAEMDWSDYNHTIDDAVVVSSWSGGLFSGDVVWDLKDYGNAFVYSNQNNVPNNIRNGRGFSFRYLRPSLRLKKMVQHVFNEVGYTIGGTLFSRGEFTNLFVTPMNTAGPFVNFIDEQFGEFTADTTGSVTLIPYSTLQSSWSVLPIGNTVITNPSGSWNSSTYEYTIPRDGDYTFQIEINQFSFDPATRNNYKVVYNGKMIDHISGEDTFINDYVWIVKIPRCQQGKKVKVLYNVFKTTDVSGEISCIESPYSIQPSVVMSNAMPDTKVVDFVNSVMQMCNAVVIPNGQNQFDLYNLDDWYSIGVNRDYTTYIDFSQMIHRKMPIPSLIEMKHQNGESVVDKYFKDTFGRNYGSITQKPDVDFANGDLKIETIFNVFPPARMNRYDNLGVVVGETDIDLPVILNPDYKPLQQKLILFYFQDFKNVVSPYQYDGTTKTYQPVSAPYTNTPTTGSSSISCTFGLEGSAKGDVPTQTFYLNFWHTFISRLFSTKSRIVICSAYLPVGEWLNMKLNDTIVISGNYYKIQKIDYNLLTEEAKLELITYPNVNKVTITGSTGKKPVLVDPVLNTDGLTYMNGIQMKAMLVNSPINTSGDYVVSPVSVSSFNDTISSQFISLIDNIKSQSIVSRVTIWENTATPVAITGTAIVLNISDTGSEAEDGMYTTGSTTAITINVGGQYRVRGSLTIEHGVGASHLLVGKILLNDTNTEGYFEYTSKETHTSTLEAVISVPEGGIIKMVLGTGDGGSHTVSVKRINMTIERIY